MFPQVEASQSWELIDKEFNCNIPEVKYYDYTSNMFDLAMTVCKKLKF